VPAVCAIAGIARRPKSDTPPIKPARKPEVDFILPSHEKASHQPVAGRLRTVMLGAMRSGKSYLLYNDERLLHCVAKTPQFVSEVNW
jgi:hypothetical protein